MRLTIVSIAVAGLLTVTSCGSSNGGGSQAPGNGDDNIGENNGRPLTDTQCADAWTRYVLAHPRGLKLRYENRSMGSSTTNTIEVTESSDAAVSEKHTNGSQTSLVTTNKQEFLKSCKDVPSDNDSSVNVTIEERRNETKTVRAGTFATKYVKSRMTQESGGTSAVVVSESWTNDEPFSTFVVYSKSVSTMGSYTFESSSELISVTRP